MASYDLNSTSDAADISRTVIPSTRAARILAALLIALTPACTVNITDFQSTESEGESGSSTTSSSESSESDGTTTGSSESGTTVETDGATDSGAVLPDGLDDCDSSGATASVSITWSEEKACESEEGCDSTQSALCTVVSIDVGETTEVSLDCEDPELGPVTATLQIERSGPGELDLAVDDEVTVEDRVALGFEVFSGRMLRVVDENGALVLASTTIGFYGGGVEGNWEEEYLQPTVAPLTSEVVRYVCGGEPLRGAVKLADQDAEVWLPSGAEGVLAGGSLWSITVERATRWSEDAGDGDLEVVVMRTKP
jgi:hypothetical protein